MATDYTPAEMVELYIKLRDHKKQAEDEFHASMERTRQGMAKLESMILAHLNETGLENVKCAAGTAYRKTEYSATVKDRESFLKFIKEGELWDLLDARANKKFVREYTETTAMVPGVEISSISSVGVRRS
jgi:hypothetical protein